MSGEHLSKEWHISIEFLRIKYPAVSFHVYNFNCCLPFFTIMLIIYLSFSLYIIIKYERQIEFKFNEIIHDEMILPSDQNSI